MTVPANYGTEYRLEPTGQHALQAKLALGEGGHQPLFILQLVGLLQTEQEERVVSAPCHRVRELRQRDDAPDDRPRRAA